MEDKSEKSNLRKLLLEKRDAISQDLIEISSKQIHKNLKKMHVYQEADTIASYFPIGSEVKTQDIMQEILESGRTLLLPKVIGDKLSFRKISGIKNLEKSNFGIMEPKEDCEETTKMDLILVPTVGITQCGIRLGYGYGYYDRYLAESKMPSVSLTYSTQVVKLIPFSDHDVKIDWIITEDRFFKTSSGN